MTSSNESGSEAAAAPQRIWNILERTTDRLDRMADWLDRMTEQDAVRARESAAFEKLMKERMKEEREEAARQREEAARQREEAARQREEAAHRSRDLDRRMQETDRRLKKAEGLFTSQWGRLMESLVTGDLVPLLQQRGVAVEMTTQRLAARRNGEHFELDILAADGTEAVAVEVKTTLRPRDVKRFEEKLARIQEWLPAYAGHRIYGAVAYLEADESVVRHAVRRGLFAIRATGSSASIVNDADFRPRAFP